MNLARARRALLATAVLATLAIVGPAQASGGSSTTTGPLEFSKTITRTHYVDGQNQVVESKNFSLTVDKTQNLHDHQEINVSWSGAHPTGGIIGDPNSGDASQQEYPVVVLECRGVDAQSGTDRIDPTTCWTATSRERYQESYSAFPPWRVDRYAAAEQREAYVGEPVPSTPTCFGDAVTEYWVPFVAADGKVFAGGGGGCAGMAPEAANVGGLALPSNTTYGATQLDGTGSIKFDVWTAEGNTSLGCSDSVPCSLVAVPILGLSCDVAASALPLADQPSPAQHAEALAGCAATGKSLPGQLGAPGIPHDIAVSGKLWWAASNWRNRVSVPLDFAPASNVCDVLGGQSGIDIYGSELMTQTALQWSPRFCLDPKLFRFHHVQTGEPQARGLLQAGTAEAIFSSYSRDGGYTKPVVNAPVAATGFAVVFAMDDGEHKPVTSLKLTPRLLAKLLTESYPAVLDLKKEYTALSANPLDLSLDPEFQALNPDAPVGVGASETASTLLSLSSDSDVIRALTDYLDHDPEARAWLDGTPDPWGMVVNPNYRGIELPISNWPLLDTFQPPVLYGSDNNTCLHDNPVAYLPLVAAPLTNLASIAQKMQFSIATSTTACIQVAEGVREGQKLVALGRQTPGYRFMLGIASLPDVARYGLVPASLQSHVDDGAPAKFTNDTGRTFVAPSEGTLRNATATLLPDAESGTWPIPYDRLRSEPAGVDAYPGTMVVYSGVPTTGLSTQESASRLAQFLRFAVGEGQTPGAGNGQLPEGYLPLTEVNGLGQLAAYTLRAADAVEAQDGTVPSLVPGDPTSTTPPPVVSSGPIGGFSANGGSGPLGRRSASVAAAPPEATAAVTIATSTKDSGTTIGAIVAAVGAFLPALLIIALLAGAGALAVYALERRRLRR